MTAEWSKNVKKKKKKKKARIDCFQCCRGCLCLPFGDKRANGMRKFWEREATNKSKSFPYAQKILRYGLSKYLYDISYSTRFALRLSLSPSRSHSSSDFFWQSCGGKSSTCTSSSPFCLSLPFYLSFDAVLSHPISLSFSHCFIRCFFFCKLLFASSWCCSLPFFFIFTLSNFSDSNLQQSENCVNTRHKKKEEHEAHGMSVIRANQRGDEERIKKTTRKWKRSWLLRSIRCRAVVWFGLTGIPRLPFVGYTSISHMF